VLGVVFDIMLIRVSRVAPTPMGICWGLAETSPGRRPVDFAPC
jgi:hypothetical protein